MDAGEPNKLIKDKLNDLDERKRAIEATIESCRTEITTKQNLTVDAEIIRETLHNIGEVIGKLPPFKQQQLFKAAFRRVGISKEQLRIEMNLDLSGAASEGGIVDTIPTRFYMTRYGRTGIGVE